MSSISASSSSPSFSGFAARPERELIEPGTVLRGRYVVAGLLGQGGMGMVYEARVQGTEERVAIKVMHAHLGRVREAEARFRREVRALRKLDSGHVARLLDFGRLESGSSFLVMEHVEGLDLVREVEARGPLSWADAYTIIDQICAAIEVVHAAGVIHRDLKPRNVVLSYVDGLPVAKVVDFGLSKSRESSRKERSPITQEGQAVGSLCYMAPEQAIGRPDLDPRSDVFSIGCILYFLLMGEPPFAQRAIARAGRLGGALEFASISFRRADVPPHVDEVLRVALSPDRHHRFRSVTALRTALANGGRDVPTLVPARPRPARLARSLVLALITLSLLTLAGIVHVLLGR